MVEKAVAARKYSERGGWNPLKKLSPEAMEGVRALHAKDPVEFSTPKLAERFEISPEAIRRILKSSWRGTAEESANRTERWEKRGVRLFRAKIDSGEIKPKYMLREERKQRKNRPGFVGDLTGGVSGRIL